FVDKEPEELIGQRGSDWFVQYKNNGLFDKFVETYLTGRRQQFDIHYQGETLEVWANVMTTKLGDELLGSFTDFTQIKQLQLQLEKSVEELRRSNTNLEEFAYAASHDLQEPLRKINFFSEQLRRDLQALLNEENIKKFDRMQNSSKRMSSLINDLLDYSKVSVKPDVYENIELMDVVEQVLQDLEATIIDTGALFDIQKLPQIKGDERQLTQVFQNLISNALKYRKAAQTPRVTIQAREINETDGGFVSIRDIKKGAYYLIEITDNGIGFEQSQAERIFNVFQRLHGRAEYEGTGVGLAIVQKVIQNHKGYIFAESEPGKGAKFLILLPV
ncbi:MAG: ATP-binding protein, partial [Bacteroidota bacterium]|nr:ATP-binding protein [Bacteroidota bacterium]